MSNGVEVIVASSRTTRPGEPEYLRLLSSTVTRPITLAPHTLTNHMSMVLPPEDTQDDQQQLLASLNPSNAFQTKSYYTTYTYLTTLVVDDRTEVSRKKTTVTNIRTEEIKLKTSKKPASKSSQQVTLAASPTLQTQVFQTAYTYMNTIVDGDQPLVMTSQHVVANTVVALEDYFSQLEPSEAFPVTNTYLKTVDFTKTLTDGTDYQVVSTQDVLTQVVVTDNPGVNPTEKPATTDVTKTYFVTYTYFSTYLDEGETKVKSDVSVSSDVTVEKFYIKPKKTNAPLEKSTRIDATPLHIFATKVYLTTFTYFTTLLQGTVGGKGETKINSRTRVVQNVVTESVAPGDLNTKYLAELESSLDNQINNPIVTLATLKDGEKIEITAFKGDKGDMSDEIYEKLKIKPTKTYMKMETNVKSSPNEEEKKPKTPNVTKTKTTTKQKQKKPVKTVTDEITAQALVSGPQMTAVTPVVVPTATPVLTNHQANHSTTTPASYSTTVLATSTVTAQGATLLPGEQVIVLHDQKGEVTLIPVSDHQKKKQEVKNPADNQVNSLLGLGSLNVLGPVINAMAELLHNNLNTKNTDTGTKRNDTVAAAQKPAPPKKTSNTNPLLSFMNGLTAATTTEAPSTKTSRKPVYIPVGSFADSQFGESQDAPVAVNSPAENWPDTQQKNFDKRPYVEKPQKNFSKVPIPILEGGIPISPGQVITTNSDVIIGRPGGSGPRPPNFAVKNNVPADMRPPPPPVTAPEEPPHDVVGQHSTHQGVDPEEDFDMVPPPPPPHDSHNHNHHHHHNHKHNPHMHLPPPPEPLPHFNYDSGTIDLNPPPVPPLVHHHQPDIVLPIPVHLGPQENVENYVNPVAVHPDSLGVPTVPIHQGQRGQDFPYIHEVTPSIQYVNVIAMPTKEPLTTQIVDRSTGSPVLVNIQPSQVANVMIPHGSSTALIISGEKQHSLKGEVIDDPKPHPEPETVGFVAEPVLKLENLDVNAQVQNEVIPVGRPEVIVTGNRPFYQPEPVQLRPRPDYDNIGMHPPPEPQLYHPHRPPPPGPSPAPVTTVGKVTNGIYVDISPPGHLPPPHVPQHQPDSVPVSRPQNINDNLSNHQSGLVHDVPLNAQVQLGSGQNTQPPIKEILVNINANTKYDSVPAGNTQPEPASYHEQNNFVHPPVEDVPDNLSPPPLPKEQYRPYRPDRTRKPALPLVPVAIPQPPEYMIPPPQMHIRPHHHPVDHNRPMMIPVGAGAPHKYPAPRPEEILIVPTHVRTESPNEHPRPSDNDLDTSDTNDPIQTEDGEEIQESNARPLLPGQVPSELQVLLHNTSVMADKITVGEQSNIGLSQTLNFGPNQDKTDVVDSGPDFSEAETIVGSKPSTAFNSNNEAVLSVGTQPNFAGEINYGMVADPENVFGSKLNNHEVPVSSVGSVSQGEKEPDVVTPGRMPPSQINDMLTPPKAVEKSEEVMGLSPPPIERPSRRPPRPHRPKPPYKFEVPTSTPRTTLPPISLENDFPPVRSPDYNRKPLKPQDIFPPRLPDNFVHHIQEFPPTRPSKPKFPVRNQERPTVTSLPIDVPSSSTTEAPKAEEINGHSKPIVVNDGEFGMRPPPLPPKRPTRPMVHERPNDRPVVHEHPPVHERPPPPDRPHIVHERPNPSYERPPPIHDRPPPVHERPPPIHDRPPPVHERPPIHDRPPVERPIIHERPPIIHDRPFPSHERPPPERPIHDRPSSHNERPPVHVIHERPPQTPNGHPLQVHERPPSVHQQRPERKPERPERPQRPIHPTPVTHVVHPVAPTRVSPTRKPDWTNGDVIVGSETVFDPNLFHHKPTQPTTTRKNIVTSLISTGSTTIFGDLYTDPILLQPTKLVTSNNGFKVTIGFGERDNSSPGSMVVVASKPMALFPTHTTTLTVTTTMTTVVHSLGQKPSTKTIVLTKTLISTIVDKVTETQTLVKPTTATVTQTHTVSTTKTALVVPTAIYPPHTRPHPAMKPEIFVADPHSKDTMTISVSSSMNKNNKKEPRPDPDQNEDNAIDQSENESILVVMTDRSPQVNMSHGHHADEDILLGGVLDGGNGHNDYKDMIRKKECLPECKATRNELCQKHEGSMKCVCRPGFARMFPDRPCKPTYTFNMKLALERLGAENIVHMKDMRPGSPGYMKLAAVTKEGLDRLVMQSDLRDVYHGIAVHGFQPKERNTMVEFYVQLSDNTDEARITEVFRKSLRATNFSLGGTELYAAHEGDIDAQDFNECSSSKFHDCSEHSRCFNLKGTYTCSCKEGFTDVSENTLFPGRLCSDMIGCELCGYHGTCYTRGDETTTCECFQWYTGERCRINLKVLLIALVTIGAILLALLLVCVVLTCIKRRSRSTANSRTNGGSSGYLRYRGPVQSQSLDKRAMIADTSSESSVENLPYITQLPPAPPGGTLGPVGGRKPALRQHCKGPAPRPVQTIPAEQRDRSLTVMIPRAKYRPVQPITPHLTMSTFSPDRHLQRTAAQIASEQKLLSYLEGNAARDGAGKAKSGNEYKTPNNAINNGSNVNNLGGRGKDQQQLQQQQQQQQRVMEYEYKTSNMNITDGNSSGDRRSCRNGGEDEARFRRHSDSTHLNTDNLHSRSLQRRKYSAGALVSAGYEVSATVGLRGCGDDEDDQSSLVNSNTLKSGRSQFTTLNRTGDHKTMSEARSYDETTIQPPTRTLKTHYSGSSPSSRVNNEEGHTMVERDLGSTFLMPGSNLFKPDRDRGSDISNFDSL